MKDRPPTVRMDSPTPPADPRKAPPALSPPGWIGPSSVAVAALLVAGVAGIGWLDFMTGPRIGFSLFYLVPIMYSGWRLGPRPSVIIGVAAAAAWFLADIGWQQTGDFAVSVWNAFTRLGIFLGMGLLTARVRADRARLEALLAEARRLALTDGLTGLANSRCFYETVQARLDTSPRDRRVAILFMDVDNFKQVNDTEGHARGDELLREIAQRLQRRTSQGDVIARFGGDEFAIAAFDRDAVDLEWLLRRLADDVESLGGGAPEARIGLSAGLAHWSGTERLDVLLRAADARMYAAKRAAKAGVES